VHDAPAFIAERLRFLDRRELRDGSVSGNIEGIGQIFGKCRQSAFFRRMG